MFEWGRIDNQEISFLLRILTNPVGSTCRGMFSTLARGYNSLQQSAQPQSAASTIDKLCDRLLNNESIEERRAALLSLKGLSRDWKSVS